MNLKSAGSASKTLTRAESRRVPVTALRPATTAGAVRDATGVADDH